MSLKRLGATLVVSLVFGAVFVSSAFATATQTANYWIVGETALSSGESATLTCSAAESFSIGGVSGKTEVEIKGTGIECPSGDVIKQEGEKGVGTATMKLSGLTVAKPSGCTIPSSITTKALSVGVYMEGATALVRLAPAEEAGVFMSFPLEGESCAAAGTQTLKGTLFGQWGNATSVEAAKQTVTFTPEIQTAAGGTLTWGGARPTSHIKTTWEILEEGAFSDFTDGIHGERCVSIGNNMGEYLTLNDCRRKKNKGSGLGYNWKREAF